MVVVETSFARDRPSLFSSAAPSFDATFAGTRRTELDASSWVEHVPGWLTGSDVLLEEMLQAVPWEQRQRWMFTRLVDEPRLTAEYPHLPDVPAPLLSPIAAALSGRYGVPYDGLWCNLYRDHQDGTSWHGDRPSCKRTLCTVPVLSLGATRRFLLKPAAGGPSIAITVAAGDLVVMGGRCQRDWRHSVPKQTRPAGVRVSVNFQSSWQALPDD